MLDLDLEVAPSCVAMLGHQDSCQSIRDDNQDLLKYCHEYSYKDVPVGRRECRNGREICEETEEDANTEEWQRYYQRQ